ncbi:hypothetical protein [Streptomyces griseorubiginosus]|uniref:hypothetical protein n=1 Tax=Streptomyces griseorubiginosus TaxID=67304 RepID=UPI0036EEF7F6
MLTTEMVRDRFIGEDDAARVAALWNEVYPAVRERLTTVIRAQRESAQPTVDVARLEQVRRELGQLDRGTFRPCTRSRPAFSESAAYGLLRDVVAVTGLGSPYAGALHRLAAVLADLVVARDVLVQAARAVESSTAP